MIAFIPVWLITILLKPFLPADHPWKYERLTLRSWTQNGTKDARDFSLIFWFMLIGALWLLAMFSNHL